MLRIDLGAVRQGPVDMAYEVAPDDPALEHVEFELLGPVRMGGRLTETGAGTYYWHGTLHARVRGACRRCLRELEVDVDQPVEVLFTEDAGSDDPAAYVVPPNAAELDPSEAVREELILGAPAYVLCGEDCRGFCPRCGSDLNAGACACAPEPDLRWAALEALKTAPPKDEGT
jgi:uncharacterized protein